MGPGICHNYSNGARRCLENWQRSLIYHKSSFLSWKITIMLGGKRAGISCNKQAEVLEVHAMSLFCPWEPGGRWERAPASRGGPAAAPSSTLLHHPPTANTRLPCCFPSKLLGFASTASDQDIETVLLETSKGTLTWKLSSLQWETKQREQEGLENSC